MSRLTMAWSVLLVALAAARGMAQDVEAPLNDTERIPATVDSSCIKCHGSDEIWEADRRHFLVTAEDLATDLHWKKGIQCHDCHGGNPSSMDFMEAHSEAAEYRAIKTNQDIPKFCGHCHSDVEYMSQFLPSPKTNQESDYWTSGHGKRLAESPHAEVANCVSCHGSHGILPVSDQASPTFPTNVAKTCGSCHSDPEKMAGIEYHGRPIGHDQYDLWHTSVHAKLLLEKGDLSAPTCNDCHGNHGAVAPDVNSVASACATCHVKIGELFNATVMKHRFDEVALPGCASCHGAHAIQPPTDEMLSLEETGVCASCHIGGLHGAPVSGAWEAKAMGEALAQLRDAIATSEEKLEHAEKLGMEVHAAKFRLRDAHAALNTARVDIHSFSMDPLSESIEKGIGIAEEVEVAADDALREYTFRRIWLSLSLVPIAIVVVLLVLYIRTLPPPTLEDLNHHWPT